MRTVLASIGTTGDILPVVWLGEELRRRGHSVTLALPPNYAELASSAGIPFAPLGPHIHSSDLQQAVARLQRKSLRNQLAEVFAGIAYHLSSTFDALMRLCADADMLVSSAYQPAGRMVYDATNMPFATLHLAPTVGAFPEHSRTLVAPLVNGARVRSGLEPLHDPAGRDSASPLLALHAVSRITPTVGSDDASYRVTGFLFDPQPRSVPPHVQRFLESGDKPIVFTFGSMIQQSLLEATRVLAESARELSLRIVVQWPWESARVDALQALFGRDVLIVDHVPHSALLPESRLVIHHGGAGTTAATLRAGVPSVVVPHILDQPDWGEILRTLGCAAQAIRRPDFTVAALTTAIAHTMEKPCYHQAATVCAELIDSESGIESAVDLIEAVVR